MMLHPGPGPLLLVQDRYPLVPLPLLLAPLCLRRAVLVRSIAVPSVIAERHATVFRSKLPPSERIKSIEPPLVKNRVMWPPQHAIRANYA